MPVGPGEVILGLSVVAGGIWSLCRIAARHEERGEVRPLPASHGKPLVLYRVHTEDGPQVELNPRVPHVEADRAAYSAQRMSTYRRANPWIIHPDTGEILTTPARRADGLGHVAFGDWKPHPSLMSEHQLFMDGVKPRVITRDEAMLIGQRKAAQQRQTNRRNIRQGAVTVGAAAYLGYHGGKAVFGSRGDRRDKRR